MIQHAVLEPGIVADGVTDCYPDRVSAGLVLLALGEATESLALSFLSRREAVSLAFIGVLAGSQLNTYRRAKEIKCLAKCVDQIACVGGWQPLGLIAVNDDQGWILAPLVGITKAYSSPPDHGRRMNSNGFFQYRRQTRCLHIPEGSGARLFDETQKLANTRSMERRNEVHASKVDEWQPEVYLPPNIVTLVLAQAVPFVNRDDHRSPPLRRESQQGGVLISDPGLRIQHRDYNIRSVNSLQCLDNTKLFYGLADASPTPYAGRIDQFVAPPIVFKRHADTVSCRAWLIVCN